MKNNLGESYLPQYLFMSYTNPSEDGYTVNNTNIVMPQPMAPIIQNEVANSLVFDKKRNSIYAQGHEYGFIADTTSEVTVRNAADNNTSTLILKVENGIISLKEYIPASINAATFFYQAKKTDGTYNTQTSHASKVDLEIGQGVKINSVNATFQGTNNVTSIQKTGLGGTKTIIVDFPNSTAGTATSDILNTMDISNCTHVKNDPGNTTFSIACKDDRMINYSSGSGAKTFTMNWYYKAYVMDLCAASGTMTAQQVRDTLESMTPANASILMKGAANNTAGGLKITKVYFNALASAKTSTGTISSTGGLNQYMVFFLPHTFTSGTAITAVFNGSATTDFKPVVTKTLTTSFGLDKQYDIYVAPADNWSGCTVKL